MKHLIDLSNLSEQSVCAALNVTLKGCQEMVLATTKIIYSLFVSPPHGSLYSIRSVKSCSRGRLMVLQKYETWDQDGMKLVRNFSYSTNYCSQVLLASLFSKMIREFVITH